MNKASDRGWSALSELNFALAQKNYQEALQVARELNDSLAEAVFLSYLAMAQRAAGHKESARKLLDQGFAIAEKLQAKSVEAHILFLLAELDREDGDTVQAIGRLWRALDSALLAQDASTTEAAFGLLAEIYRDRGWLEQAFECFYQAYEANEQADNKAAWLGNLGQTLAELGDHTGAIDYYKKALALAESRDDLKTQSRCWASLGLVHFVATDYEQALHCLEKAQEDGQAQSALLGNLGNVYLKLGDLEKAKEVCRKALALAEASNDQKIVAAQLDSIGDCYFAEAKFAEALNNYEKAYALAKVTEDRLAERIYLTNQGKALYALSREKEALAMLEAAAQLFEEQRGKIQSDSLKTAFSANGQDLYQELIKICLRSGRRVEAIEYVGRAKSRAMLDMLSNSPIDIADLNLLDDKNIAQLVYREQDLRARIAELERIYGHEPDSAGGLRSSVTQSEDAPKLYKEWRGVVDQLKRRHPSYASMIAVDALNFAEIQKLWELPAKQLSEADALFEFFVTDTFLLTAALWDGATEPEIRVLEGEEFVALQNDLFDFLEMSSTEGWLVPESLCRRLYERIFADLCLKLPAYVQRLLLVPHGFLHKLPFAALHDGQKYLIERYALSTVSSASLVKLLGQNTKTAQSGYLVSAISDYSATRSSGIVFNSRLRSSSGLEDLSYTLEEGRQVLDLVAPHVTEAKFLADDEVKEGLLKRFREYSVIHFAGHAIFNPDEPMASGLVLGDGSVLTAARILEDTNFRTTCGRLLILSACQTGVNFIAAGGEMLGLVRALIYAGMRNLISSLWEVADRSTSLLMQDFYRFWANGKIPIAQALQKAQCKAIGEGLPIHAWAPFIHFGVD
ncbi:MAG: CHAT domain-containing protein [Candidatus Obscuribacterales bacterium]|nr:CHAT domain-containing protein [Candidatus Obscuribacterales bacterium]